MVGQTFTARQTARAISAKLGREVSDKRVRAWVRDNVAAYDDDGYTAHSYDVRLRDRIVAAFVTKSKSGRTVAAQTGRKAAPKATKSTARAPKAATVVPTVAQDQTPRAGVARVTQTAPQLTVSVPKGAPSVLGTSTPASEA